MADTLMRDSESSKVSYGLGSDLPPELQLEARRNARRQAIAEALIGQAMTPAQGRMVGRFYAPAGGLQALSKVTAGYFGGKLADQASQGEADLSRRYNTGLTSALQEYQRRRDGGQPFSSVVFGDDNAQHVSQADPHGAAVYAATSGYGPLQRVGMEELKQLGKNKTAPSLSDMLKLGAEFEPASLVQASMLISQGATPDQWLPVLRRKSEIKGFEGRFADMRGGSDMSGPGTGRPFTGMGGGANFSSWNVNPVYDQKSATFQSPTGPVDIPVFVPQGGGKPVVPPANITNVNNFPENAFSTAFAKGQAEDVRNLLKGSREQAADSMGDIYTIANAAKAYNQGIKTGSYQGARNEIEKFLNTAGITSPDPKVSNTDFFMRTMAERILKYTKELRPLSDPDRSYLEEIKAGKNMTDQALQRELQIALESGFRQIMQHNDRVEQYKQLPGVIPQAADMMRVPIPPDIFPITVGQNPPEKPKGRLTPVQ